MPHITVSLAANTALAFPPLQKLKWWFLLRRGYDHEKDAAGYVTGVHEKHARSAPADARRVLEIGPGGNLGPLLLFLNAGADSAAAVDAFPWLSDQMPLYRQLVPDPDALMERLSYRCPEKFEQTGLPSESFDFIYSHACLEHVTGPAAAVDQIARLLAPGGTTSHQIDLRDHRDFDEPLVFLRYSDRIWEAASSRLVYTNRWRASDWTDAFEAAGLEVLAADATNDPIPLTEAERDKMNERFRQKTLADLSIAGLLITARKPK